MGYFSIIAPESTVNLVANPSVENNTTGYTAVGGSISRVTTLQRRGVASLEVTPTAGLNDGVYYSITLSASTQYCFSVDILGALETGYKIYAYDVTSGTVIGTPATYTGDEQWHRHQIVFTTNVNTAYRLYVVKNGNASTAPFYIDGLQCEQKGYATTYCDGDQPGCSWDSTPHASTSRRDSQSRAGGREYDLSNLGINVLSVLGIGMPTMVNWSQDNAIMPGAQYRGTKAGVRTVTLVLMLIGSSINDLHAKRSALINLIKPDGAYPDQPFILRYTGTGKTLEIPLVYDGGLEQGEWQGNTEQIALRCLAYDEPYWIEEGEYGAALETGRSLTVSAIVARVDGEWNSLNGGLGGSHTVNSLEIGPDGLLYAAGMFNPPLNLARWNGSAWEQVGGITSDTGIIYRMVFLPNGDLVICGYFSNINGVPNTSYIARWDGTNWHALGTGANLYVYDLAVAADGSLYAVGLFTSMGGVANTRGIARWDGTAWQSVGGGLNNQGNCVVVARDGQVYVGGFFTMAGSTTAARIARWDGSAWHPLGSGASNNAVNTIAIHPNGVLFAGGTFSGMGGVSGTRYLAQWNGTQWSAVGNAESIITSSVYRIKIGRGRDGLVYVCGQNMFSNDQVVVWNGTSFSRLDIELPGAPYVRDILISESSTWVGFSTAGNAIASGTVTIDQPGTASTTKIVIELKRSGGTSANVRFIRNETTGKTIYLDYDLQDGEKLTIDLRPGSRKVESSYYGNVSDAIEPQSDFASFALVPGENKISAYVVTSGSPTVDGTIRFRAQYWSADG